MAFLLNITPFFIAKYNRFPFFVDSTFVETLSFPSFPHENRNTFPPDIQYQI